MSAMAMGQRKRRAKQASMWVATQDLPRRVAHRFYAGLNPILDEHDVDGSVEALCERFYADEDREAHTLLEELAEATLAGTRKDYFAELATVPMPIIDDLGMWKPARAPKTFSS
jgi:hypothetical protein